MLCIDRNESNLAVSVTEFVEAVLEGDNLGRAHEGEGSRNEE